MKTKSTLFTPLLTRACVASAALAVILCQPALFAAPLYWDGNGTTAGAGNTTGLLNKVWGTDSMWNSDPLGETDTFTAVTGAGDDLFFVAAPGATSGQIDFNPSVTGTQAANSITFQSQGAQVLSGGTAINLGAGGLVGAQLAFGATNRGAVTISSAVALQASQIWANNATNSITVSGVISGASNLTVQNAATASLFLSGANTGYSGATTLASGILRGTNTAATDVLNAFGTGAINLNGGSLQLKANGTGNNKTIVAGNNVSIGSNAVTVDVNNRSANTGSNITFTNLSLGSGQMNVTGGNSYSLRVSGTTTLTGNATINATTANLGLVGIVSGGFGLTKTGASAGPTAGGVTLSGANSYTGDTAVLEGRLILNGAAPSGSAGTLGNATSAVLLGNTSGAVNAFLFANDYTIARNIIVQSGNTGTATLGSTATSTNTTTYSGAVTLGSPSGTSHPLTLTAAANHNINITGVIQDPAGLVGTAGVVTISDATFANGTIDNSNNNTNGSTSMILSGANTYSGGTVINFSGTARINHDSAFGTGNLSIVKATITQGTSATALAGVSGITLDGNLTLNSFTFGAVKAVNLGTVPITLTANRIISAVNNTSTVGGVISGVGRSLQVNGGGAASGLALNGANSFDGGLIVAGHSAATLTVSSGNASGLGAGQVTLTNSANSKVGLSANTTVVSLTSGINNSATFTGGTSALAAGTYPLTITGGGGSGAAGTATVNSSGVVTAVNITNVGSNYTSEPTITLDSSTATITLAAFGSSSIALAGNSLTISGTNASPAIYAGAISGGSLVKNGTGTQILTGANTYSGNTTIGGGTLNISGSLGSTDVWVDPSGTLTGTGSIAGNVTVTGDGHLACAVAATPGAQVPLQITGALTIESENILDLTATPTPASGVYILATATGGVTYTAGTVNLTGVSGVVSVSGDNLSLILTVGGGGGSNYASWATANGIPGEPASGDYDKDGLDNFVEYALGLNPKISSQSPGTLTGKVLKFTKGIEAIANNDVIFEIEESTDLGISDPWTVAASEGAGDDTPDISYDLAIGGNLKHFARLKVTLVP